MQFGCFTPLMHAHSRFEQEPWTYDDELLDIYRAHVLLHERLVPYIRAAAATAARAGLPIIRPLALTDPADIRGWAIADAYGYGPSLWVAPVLEEGARACTSTSRAATGSTPHTGAEIAGGGEVDAEAPLDRDPVLGPPRRADRHLPASTSPPRPRGRAGGERPLRPRSTASRRRPRAARLADGTRIRYNRGEWSVTPERAVEFRRT